MSVKAIKSLCIVVITCLVTGNSILASEGLAKPGVDPTAFVKMFIGLIAVIALIFLLAWLTRKMNLLKNINSGHQIKNLATLSLGTREKVSLIEVGNTQILVGITPQSVSRIHLFDEPVDTLNQVEENTSQNENFTHHFKKALGQSLTGDKK